MAPAPADSEPLEAGETPACFSGWNAIKMLVGLFLIFLLVSSRFFVYNVAGPFGGAELDGPNPTGTVVQGVALVFAFAILAVLVERRVL